MAERPGTMVYFDFLDMVTECTDEELGKLFRGILVYGRYGVLPDFEDRALRVLWNSVQIKIDVDEYRYRTTCISNEYKVYKRESKKRKTATLELDDWLVMNHPELSSDINRYLFDPTIKIKFQTKLSTIKNQQPTDSGQQAAVKTQQTTENRQTDEKTVIASGYKPPTVAEFNDLRNTGINRLKAALNCTDSLHNITQKGGATCPNE